MNKVTLRLLFAIPPVLLVGFLFATFGDVASLPIQAQEYLHWYQSQPLTPTYWLLNKLGVAALIGLMLFTCGLLFFWSGARYGYVVCTLILVGIGAYSDPPLLMTGAQIVLDDVATLFLGLNISLVFFSPASSYFVRKKDLAV